MLNNRNLLVIFIIWNVITFFLYGIDKQRSKTGKWRIGEKTLLLCAYLMGGIGALLGMQIFRHKTKHLKFKILVPLGVICNIALIVGGYYFLQA